MKDLEIQYNKQLKNIFTVETGKLWKNPNQA